MRWLLVLALAGCGAVIETAETESVECMTAEQLCDLEPRAPHECHERYDFDECAELLPELDCCAVEITCAEPDVIVVECGP